MNALTQCTYSGAKSKGNNISSSYFLAQGKQQCHLYYDHVTKCFVSKCVGAKQYIATWMTHLETKHFYHMIIIQAALLLALCQAIPVLQLATGHRVQFSITFIYCHARQVGSPHIGTHMDSTMRIKIQRSLVCSSYFRHVTWEPPTQEPTHHYHQLFTGNNEKSMQFRS